MVTESKTEAQSFRERAQKARQAAEGTPSASEQARLNQHANDLDKQAAVAERRKAHQPPTA
jgi:hypothetical protein